MIKRNLIISPCYDCKDRVVNCHSKCILYKKFRERHEARKKLKREAYPSYLYKFSYY